MERCDRTKEVIVRQRKPIKHLTLARQTSMANLFQKKIIEERIELQTASTVGIHALKQLPCKWTIRPNRT